jgi:hypothetical protein
VITHSVTNKNLLLSSTYLLRLFNILVPHLCISTRDSGHLSIRLLRSQILKVLIQKRRYYSLRLVGLVRDLLLLLLLLLLRPSVGLSSVDLRERQKHKESQRLGH